MGKINSNILKSWEIVYENQNPSSQMGATTLNLTKALTHKYIMVRYKPYYDGTFCSRCEVFRNNGDNFTLYLGGIAYRDFNFNSAKTQISVSQAMQNDGDAPAQWESSSKYIIVEYIFGSDTNILT